jgi:hypothetical protein
MVAPDSEVVGGMIESIGAKKEVNREDIGISGSNKNPHTAIRANISKLEIVRTVNVERTWRLT